MCQCECEVLCACVFSGRRVPDVDVVQRAEVVGD